MPEDGGGVGPMGAGRGEGQGVCPSPSSFEKNSIFFLSLAAKCAQSWETDAFKALPSISDGDPKMLLHLFFIFEGKKYLLMSH